MKLNMCARFSASLFGLLLFANTYIYAEVLTETAEPFQGWVLDIDGNSKTEQLGGWKSSRNLVLTRPKNGGRIPSGAKWNLVGLEGNLLKIVCTAESFNGWVLDIDGDAKAEKIGNWDCSKCLVLTRPKDDGRIPSGGKWQRAEAGEGVFKIVCTADCPFRGWVLDINGEAKTEELGSWQSSRNLLLTRPKQDRIPSGGKWRIK